MTSQVERNTEESMIINSVYYCPNCTGGGNLFVKNTEDYFDKKPVYYYCKQCKRTFKIEDVFE